jgi:hypothetical protein
LAGKHIFNLDLVGVRAFYWCRRFLPEKDGLKPSEGGDDHFEQAAPEQHVEVTYGLNMMGRHRDGELDPAEREIAASRAADGAPPPHPVTKLSKRPMLQTPPNFPGLC